MKPAEIRIPNPESRKKSEFRNPKSLSFSLKTVFLSHPYSGSGFGFRNSFGFRISDFGFPIAYRPSPIAQPLHAPPRRP